ncbi:MAG TPA: membrane protein insertion efficiency factor YidD [Thermodesulfovibrionales bacterium]|nr:membrane protein insertion efficiency factor YidD [Thermodesulfovibrionales bacterium]
MKKLLIATIKTYKYAVSPMLPSSCRFTPTCSEYAMDAITKYGAVKGTSLAALRILKCNPFHEGGCDPVK